MINGVGNALLQLKGVAFDADGVIKYGAALEGLSAKQIALVLSSKGLNAAEKEQAMVSAGLIVTSDAMSAGYLKEKLSQVGVTDEIFKQISLRGGLITTEGNEIITTQILTQEKVKELLSYTALSDEQKAKILQNFAEASSNGALTVSYEVLTTAIKGAAKALWTFLITNPVGWAILAGVAIVGVAKAYDTYNKKQEEAIQKARELQEEYHKQSKETSDHIKSLKDQQKEFERLSKGVDDYGNNISLSSDEYERYKSIVSEILGYSPNLIAGYDEEGNAIAKKNGLIEQSIELMKEEQRQKLKDLTSKDNTDTLYKGAKKDYKEATRIVNNTDYSRGQTLLRATAYDKQGKLVTPTNGVNTNRFVALTDILAGMTGEKFSDFAPENTIQDSWKRFEKFAEYLEKYRDVIGHNYDEIIEEITKDRTVESGITVLGLDDDQVDEFRSWIKQIYDDIDEREERAHGMDDQFMLFAQSADAYDELSDAQKNFVTDYIKATGSIVDAEGNLLSQDEIYKKAQAYTDFAEKLATDENFKEARDKINDLFAIDKKSLSAKDYEQQVTAIIDYLQQEFELSSDDAKKLKIQFGIEFLSDGSTQTGTLIQQVKDHLQDEFDDKVDTLTLDDLKLAAQFAVDEDTQLSWDELIEKIALARLKAEQKINLDSFNKQIDEMQSAYDTLKKARDEYNKNGAYSLDTVQALLALEPQYLAMLVSENGQLVINEQAMRNLVQAQLEEAKSKIYANGIAQLNALIEKKAGEASEEAGEKRANAVTNIDAETKAVGLNTEAELQNMATKAANAKVSQEEIDEIVNNTLNSAKTLEKAISSLDIDFGGTMSGFDDTNKKLEDTQKQIADLNDQQALADLKYSIETVNQELEQIAKTLERIDELTDLTFENDFTTKLQNAGQQFLTASRYGGQMREEMERLLAIEPQSASEAEELASSLENLSDKFFDNEQKILEYRNAMYETVLDFNSALAENEVTKNENAKKILDDTYDILEHGSLSGGFWSRALLPSVSKDKVSQQRAENNKLLKEEERYQNAIAEIRKKATDMSKAEEDAERAKQRQEYLQELSEAQSGYESSITRTANIANEATSSMKDGVDDLTNSIKNASDEWDSFNSKYAQSYQGQTSDVSGKFTGNELTDAALSKISQGSFVDTHATYKGNPVKALYDEASKAYKFYVYENVSGNATYREFTPEEYIRDVNDTLLNAEGGVTSGVTIVNEGTGSLSGREGYIGKDGKLHWFKDEKNLMFNTDDVVRVISAPDMANIIKYTGTKFFNEPISDLSSVTVDNYASGNTNVSFRTPSSSKQSVTVDVDDVTQAFIDGINQSLSEIKDNVTLEALKESFYENLTDEEFISTFAYGISTATKTAVDEADENMSNAIKALILQNSAWDDLPDELREKFAKLGAVAENWSEWIGNGDNTLQAFNLMENSDVSSWDILDQNVTTLLQEYGIHGKEAWDTFIEENPLQALQLLLSSWDALSTLIQQYMDDMTTTVTNGAAAIKAVKIDAPSISQESWDALQTLIANKIQEILNVINETFGANTVDLNFGISTSLQTTSTGNGAAMGSIPYYNQGDYADYTYGSGSMAQTACGPTSMAMVLSGLSGKSVSPVETARWAESHGHYIQGAGTSWAFFNAIASEYGIKSQSISYSADNLRTALSGGNIVITSMAPGHFTKNGHFIVLTGLTSDGQVMVNDPGSRERTHAWDLNTVANEAKQAWAFSAYATGTGGAKAGMAILGDEGLQKGDTKNAYPELVFSKSTGKAFLAGLNGAEMVRLGAGDTVVPYSDTKKFLSNGSSFNAYAKGTKSAKKAVRNQSEKQNNQNTQMSSQTKALQSWDVPQGLGKSHSYTAFDEDGYLGPSLGHWSKGSAAWQLFQQLLATGNLTTDQNGIYTYKGARLIAMTSTFGKAGDVMRFTQDDGSVYYGIIMDEKSQSYTWYDNNPANAWGHQNGQDIVEFEVKRSAIAPAYKANGGTPPYGNLSHYISTIENLGSLEGFDFSNISDVATNPLLIKYQEALKKIQDLMGVFQTNTHTAVSKVANYKSLGDKRGKYGFDATFTAHANGTGDYHIVGENNKPEIMRDKRTGKLSVVDSPMLFDPNEYDVIGEKTTAEYLKSAKLYANGTTDAKQTQTEEEKEEKKKQEEAEKQAEKDREAMQKSLDTINEHLSEGNKLTLEGNTYSKEELEKMANLMSDFGEEEIVDPDKLNTILDYASYFKELDEWIEDKLPDLLESYNEQYERDYNAERAKYLEWQKDYTSRVNKFNENPTSGNYMDEWLKLLDEGHAQTMATLNTQTKLNADSIKQSLASLKDPLKKAEEMWLNAPTATLQRKALETLNNIRETEDDLNSQYVDIISKLGDQRVQEIEQRNLGFQSRLSFLDSDNSSIDRALDKVQSAAEQSKLIGDKIQNSISQVGILEEQRNASHQDVIDNIYNSADEDIQRILQTVKVDEAFDANGEFNDIYYKQIEALGNLENGAELVAKYEELVMKPLQEDKKTWAEATGAIEELTDSIDDLELQRAQTKIEVYTENLERLNEIDEVRKSKQDAITSAMEKQHSLAQSLREEISSINAELDANKHTEQWLDEDTRKLIFNDEDYEAELKAINDIQAEATREYNRYKSKIAGLNETEWYQEQKITDEYNKRMDVLNEQLQVEKDKLAVKKKELEYNNALKERDTRIIIGGRSVQVANPDTMYNLAKERSQAQSDLNNTLLKNSETEQERQSDRISQSINQEIETRNKMVELIGKMSDAEQELFAATLPVIQELEVFKEALSPQNIPWLNSHSRDFRDDFVDMPELYKHGGYNQAHDYAGDYPIIEQLYHSGIIRDEVYEVLTQQAENQHNWKRSTDVNTAQYPYTSKYGDVNYGEEYYGINDEDKWAQEQAREYNQLAYEINHGIGTKAQLDRIKELNDNNAADNKYIANTLDTTLYTVNEDGIVVREGQKIGIDDDSMQQIGEIARGVVESIPKEGSIAHGDYSAVKPRQKVGEIAHGDYSKYASGTKSAKAGLALTDEEGYEFKLKQLGGKFRALDGGEMIFSNPQSANLFEFSQNPPNYIQEQIAKMNGQMASVVTNTDNRKSEVHNHFDIHDFDVNKPTNVDAFMGELLNRASGRYDVTKNIKH